MSAQNGHFFGFGPFRLDADERVLWRDGQPVPLTSKAFETLLVLVEHRGHIVGKEELLREVWPDSFVEEGNLSFNVSLLRKALGEDAHRPQFIETVARRGYRFIADVRAVDGHEVSELMVETRTRSSIVVEEEETDEESSTAGGGARVAAAVKMQPATAATIAQPVGESKWLFKSKTALAQTLLISAAAVVVAVAVVAYFFYPTHSGEAIDSVAVLSFVNAGGDPEAEYLSEGITDNIISSLSRLPNLRVISLNTVLRYKGKQIDPQAIGREMNVRAVLIGRMTQRGDALSISTELVDVRDNRRLWGAQYNGKPSDILVVQEKIAGEIAEKLRLGLGGPEKQRLAKHSTESTDAYQAYARGRFLLRKRTGPAAEKSVEYFEQSIKLDPNYALAYAALANAHISLSWLGARLPGEVLPRAKAAAAKALAIDDMLAEAQAALGSIKLFEWDWAGAERAFKRARELNPNYERNDASDIHYLRVMKRFDEAVAEGKRILELEPVSVSYDGLAVSLYYARRYDEAIEQSKKNLELDPNMPTAYRWLAKSYEQKKLYDQAVEAYLKTVEFAIHGPEAESAFREAYAESGWKGFWRKSLDLKKERAKPSPYAFAETYARLGEKDQAFTWLEKTYEQRLPRIMYLNADPLWDDLRSDPRYADLVRRMGLEP